MLAWRLAQAGTLAPGGTRWPRFSLPNEHNVYALIEFEGETVYTGGPTATAAMRALATELLARAQAVADA